MYENKYNWNNKKKHIEKKLDENNFNYNENENQYIKLKSDWN